MPLPIEVQCEYIEQVKSNFLKSRLSGIIPVEIYDFLVENGAIDLTNEEKKSIRFYVEEALNRSRATMKPAEWRNLVGDKVKYETHVRNECKRRVVANFFLKEHAIDNF